MTKLGCIGSVRAYRAQKGPKKFLYGTCEVESFEELRNLVRIEKKLRPFMWLVGTSEDSVNEYLFSAT